MLEVARQDQGDQLLRTSHPSSPEAQDRVGIYRQREEQKTWTSSLAMRRSLPLLVLVCLAVHCVKLEAGADEEQAMAYTTLYGMDR